jgi:uncharacterized repeat protein (TIGR01451 family)
MNTSIQHPKPNGIVQPSGDLSQSGTALSVRHRQPGRFAFAAVIAGLLLLLFGVPSARADQSPPGCTGSGLGIQLFTDSPDVHIGDTLTYSVTVFNGTGVGPVVCDASSIQAFIVTPDGVSHPIALVRTNLSNGQADFYPNVVTYVVRAQDIKPDGTVDATASDTGVIHQNDVNSQGGGNQGVNTQVSLPCIGLTAQCVGSVGENGEITFTGTVTNCGNNTLVGVVVTNFVNGGMFTVLFPTNLVTNQIASFSGSWVPLNPCSSSTATLVVQGTDQYTTHPRTVTSFAIITCSDVLTPGIVVTKSCPVTPVAPGQLLTFSGSVSNSGNVTLTNIVVVNNQPVANTAIFSAASLAPGAVTNFTGSYAAPTNCSVADTLTATAASICGVFVSDTASATCPILTTPQIAVTATCPVAPVLPGGSLTYSGTVQNTGDITLTNVVVVSDHPVANTIVLTVATLAPGVSTNFTAGPYTVPANACTVTTAFSGTGQSICTLNTVTNTISTTCTVTTTPGIGVTLACPVVPAAAGGLITYTGTVTNSGNVTLNNVTVVDNQASPSTVLTLPSLASHASANFNASFIAPAGACSVSSTVTATGSDNCTQIMVTNTASATCTLITAPAIAVTQVCPESPAIPGGLLTYSGTVSNSGNVTLTNVVVLNNLSGATPVFTVAMLAPGAVTNFTGSYVAPASCSSTSTSTATGQSICGIAVTNTASTTCPITTAPAIAVTQICPVTPPIPGGLLTYSGSVSNAGNIMLTNVVVLNNLSGATPLISVATLAPGAVTNFTGNYVAPASCSSTSTSTATGQSICGVAVTNTASTTCPIITAPAIAVTQVCPVTPPIPGGLLTYSGSVSNAGNVMLTNVIVLNNLSGATPVITVSVLAPGAVTNFTGSYVAPASCSSTSTSTATGQSICGIAVTNTASTTCPITTAPAIAVTQICPVTPPIPGGLLTYSGSVSNAGNIMLTNVVVLNNLSGATPLITVATLAPGAVTNFTGSYVAPASCSSTSISTATGRSICGVAVTNTASTTCPIITAPLLAITQNCPVTPPIPGGLLTYSGSVSNAGNVMLTNVVVLNNLSGATPVISVATLAPGAVTNFTGSYVAPASCSSTSTSTVTGQSICGVTVTNTASTTCPITTAPAIAVTQLCPVTPPIPGGLLTYSGSVSNAGNIMLTNVVVLNNMSGATPVFTAAMLAPGAVTNFTGSYVAPASCSSMSTSTATGESICGVAVTNTASTTCPITTAPGIIVTKVCPTQPVAPGQLLTFSGSVSNNGNVTLTNIVVVNNQPVANTMIFTVASLAPGAVTNFTGSYVAPTNCAVADTLIATGRSICSVAVTNTVSATCPILTAPAIEVTQTCPIISVLPGGILTYSGTVSNAGNITLTNIIVMNNRPANNTVIFTAVSLAPGATTNFTGSYQVPVDCCVVWSTVQASGQGCAGVTVTDTDTATCTVLTLPQIVVTKVCAPGVLRPGDLLTYSGSVSNAGNITLVNVTVVNNHDGGTLTLSGNGILAPGETASYTASYVVPVDFCGSDTVTASASDYCSDAPVANSVTTTCPITTTPRITVTKNCPLVPTPRGGLFTYTGSVSNAGNVTLVDVFVVDHYQTDCYTWTNGPVVGPITLAPGASVNFSGSYTAPMSCCQVMDTVTASGQDRCSGSNVMETATAICPLLTTPSIAVVQNCPVNPIPMGSVYVFGGYVTNSGDVVLTNVFVFSPQGTNTPVLGPINLAPGESETYSGSYTVPSNTCSVSVTASGSDLCGGNLVINTASCPVATTALLAMTQNCPVAPVVPGGLLTYSGTVSNAGNITLNNIMVVNNQSGNTPLITVAALAPGAAVNFNGSYLAPTNCSSTSTSTATGQSICGVAVTNTVSATCPITIIPIIAITQNCPVSPTVPGALLTYSGTVSNAGSITLINIVVTNSQSGNTPLFPAATLAPGESTNFTGSYIAPVSPTTTSTSTVHAMSLCGVPVTNSASSTCPIVTTPAIAVTKLCPPALVAPGGTLVFTGTVTNTGNITLTNVFVVDSQPAPNTPVLGPITLAPGMGTNFTGSYLVPLNICSMADTLTATGNDASTGIAITNTASATCELMTTPVITITEDCPPGPVTNGGSVVFGGSVCNSGNITLTNILVFSGQPSNFLVLGPITLAPGACAPFTGSYFAVGGSNPTTNLTIVTNSSSVITTNLVPVITTNNTVTITTNNVTPTFGTIDPLTGILTDRFNVITNLHGLMFADQDENWGPTLFYVIHHPASGPDTFDTISATGVITPRFNLTETNYNALTQAAPDVGYGEINFYYLRHDTANWFGEIIAQGASSSADLWPVTGAGYTGLAFAAADVGTYGANLFYYVRNDVTTGLSWFGTINPTPGGVETDRYAVGTNFDALVFVPGTVSTWGTAIFAYLRHDNTGSIIGTIDPVAHVVTDRLNLGTNLITALTFTSTDVGFGANQFYYLRPASTTFTTNTVTTYTTNMVTAYTTNAVTTYTTNGVVSFTPTNTVTATGMDICQTRTVVAAANCLGPVVPTVLIIATPKVNSDGFFSLSFPTEVGTSYTVQYKNTLSDPAWTDLVPPGSVPGTGGPITITDATSAGQPTRFYRIMATP